MSTDKMTSMSIDSESNLEEVRNIILHHCRKYKIETIDSSKKCKTKEKSSTNKPMVNDNEDEKEGFKEHATKGKYSWDGQMFEDVSKMENTMDIKDTDLEKELMAFEKRLISKSGKKHISRKCHAPTCKQTAPSSYPNNLYLCDKHKRPLYEKLESYKIPLNKGSADEQKKCKELNDCHQKVIYSLRISDAKQSFGNNQHKYPPNYFTVCMSKLLLCQQELTKPLPSNSDQKLRDSCRKMKEIVKKLMDLLITARQNLNCHWCEVIRLIISVCGSIPAAVAWMVANSTYISIVFGYVHFLINTIVNGFIFAAMYLGRDAAYVAGAAAVGAGVGAAVYSGAEAGAAIGSIGGPAGAVVGGVCGALIGGGLAMMYRYG